MEYDVLAGYRANVAEPRYDPLGGFSEKMNSFMRKVRPDVPGAGEKVVYFHYGAASLLVMRIRRSFELFD